MGGEGIYHKTEKGRTEIATRANKLGLRERTMLIMVDDKTSRSGLLSRNAHPSSGDILDAPLAQCSNEIAGGLRLPAQALLPRQLLRQQPLKRLRQRRSPASRLQRFC